MSKGSSPRPVDQTKYRDNYELIFGKKQKDKNETSTKANGQ